MSTLPARTVMSVADIVTLGYALDTHGFVRCEADVRRIVTAAGTRGIDGPAIGVLADTTAPDVARLRAFAVVSAALAHPDHPSRPGALLGAA